jgi:hypothetical protein
MQNPLPPETERLWTRLKGEPLLTGWYLVGGTALALRIGHRRSEDLDLAWPGGLKLPVTILAQLMRLLEGEGWKFDRDDDAKAYDEFLIAGMSLHDYQQSLIATGTEGIVKVTFFSPEGPLARLLPVSNAESVVVPDLPVLFSAKAVVTSQRSAARDWLDLYVLMTDHGFTMEDFAGAFRNAGAQNQLELAMRRLCSGSPRPADPGYETLNAVAPTVEVMASFFRNEVRKWKERTAGEAWESQADVPS